VSIQHFPAEQASLPVSSHSPVSQVHLRSNVVELVLAVGGFGQTSSGLADRQELDRQDVEENVTGAAVGETAATATQSGASAIRRSRRSACLCTDCAPEAKPALVAP
jgi:hypothetical protein